MLAEALGEPIENVLCQILTEKMMKLHAVMKGVLPADSGIEEELKKIADTAADGNPEPADRVKLLKRYLHMLNSSINFERLKNGEASDEEKEAAMLVIHKVRVL